MAFITTADALIPLSDYSTFDKPPYFSSNFPVPEDTATPCNFITFLAAAQKLQVPFLKLRWEPKRQLLGRGGTSQINQARMTLHENLAFKRITDKDKLDKPEEETLRCLINEMTVLRYPSVKGHPNILELQGICWDIPSKRNQNDTAATPSYASSDNKVWPSLVFEKSQFGDLYHFASLPIGRKLDIKERLNICLDVGYAIAHMQSNSIIHGDIKPDNILVFKHKDGFITAKVADFGFSTWCVSDNSCIVLPRSWPWYAPECDEYSKFTAVQALKTDVFSFGMLCLWFMFEKQLSRVLPLPKIAQREEAAYNSNGTHQLLEFLQDLKKTDSLKMVADQLVMEEVGLDTEARQMLQHFFRGCLASDPKTRDVDVQHSLERMSMQREPVAPVMVGELYSPIDHDFRLCHSLEWFYFFDFRLRSYILQSLETIVSKHPTSPLSTQLAICYELGFGNPEGGERLKSFIYDKEQVQIQLEEVRVSRSPNPAYAGTLIQGLVDKGQDSPLHPASYYMREGMAKAAESLTKKDLECLERVLGVEHYITILLKSTIAGIAYHQGRNQEAGKLGVEIMNWCRRIKGEEHHETLLSMGNLAVIYIRQDRLTEAEKLLFEVIDIHQRKFGKEHSRTLTFMENLAAIYYDQCQWDKSAQLYAETLDVRRRIFGEEHASTVHTAANLASVYRKLGRQKEAERLEDMFMDVYQRIADEDSDTAILALVSQNPDMAEKFGMEVMDVPEEGFESLPVRAIIGNLAKTYRKLGRWEEAEMVDEKVIDMSEELFSEDPDGLFSTAALLSACQSGEAEKFGIEMLPRAVGSD